MASSILTGDVRECLRGIPDGSVHCVVTSPPYWGLRDYGVEGQLGLEPTVELYVEHMVQVFGEVRRVLRDDGTLWLNMGDCYSGGGGYWPGAPSEDETRSGARGKQGATTLYKGRKPAPGLKPKDLVGQPWRVAFALQADGWYLRSDIIWCLSGGAYIYARTQKGVMPMTIKDMARLDPATVQLWNGKKWTQMLSIIKNNRRGDELEIVLRSGERISCTPTHRFPTTSGLADAIDLKVGDVLMSCRLPEPESPRDCSIDEDAAWFAGLYVAEGSRSGDTIQISGHVKECKRWARVQRIASKFGGSATRTEDGNNQAIRVYGKILNAIIDELVTGRTSHDKGFASVVWRYSDRFIAAMVDGYLSGDGYADNNRWRLGFCRNYNLERDLRTACARLGYILTLNLANVKYDSKQVRAFRGELRKERSGHHNERDRNEIVKIRKARCRKVYDLSVRDNPHVFALASGVLTHNSKPNPMPESCRDRPTKSHEYVFLLTKRPRYFFDQEAVREVNAPGGKARIESSPGTGSGMSIGVGGKREARLKSVGTEANGRNIRSVWTIATQAFPEAHFATFPEALPERCIKAGTSEKGCCPVCGASWARVVERKKGEPVEVRGYQKDVHATTPSITHGQGSPNAVGFPNSMQLTPQGGVVSTTTGWEPSCDCQNEDAVQAWDDPAAIALAPPFDPIPCTVLDPFVGSGTTALVAVRLGRSVVGIDLSEKYTDMIRKQLAVVSEGDSRRPKKVRVTRRRFRRGKKP